MSDKQRFDPLKPENHIIKNIIFITSFSIKKKHCLTNKNFTFDRVSSHYQSGSRNCSITALNNLENNQHQLSRKCLNNEAESWITRTGAPSPINVFLIWALPSYITIQHFLHPTWNYPNPQTTSQHSRHLHSQSTTTTAFTLSTSTIFSAIPTTNSKKTKKTQKIQTTWTGFH